MSYILVQFFVINIPNLIAHFSLKQSPGFRIRGAHGVGTTSFSQREVVAMKAPSCALKVCSLEGRRSSEGPPLN